ncbi:hypothetical protein AA313_de0200760 [Arthrobotrys entomopaga]|nr:hypothetical protein AA313_de0200760 [Arthrobotrys entomopaga]
MRQLVFACMACTSEGLSPAGVCYSCSISCHGSHGELVELFSKRNFECDCGTTRMPLSCCKLRNVQGDEAQLGNRYNHNFRNLFCDNERYEAENEYGTMYQCLLGDCCGEDWFHDRCILGNQTERGGQSSDMLDGGGEPKSSEDEIQAVQAFPDENTFDHFICWKCVSGNPWLRRYIGSTGFLKPVIRKEGSKKIDGEKPTPGFKKRKISEINPDESSKNDAKERATAHKTAVLEVSDTICDNIASTCTLPESSPLEYAQYEISLFFRSEFREHICRCVSCLEILRRHRILLEDEVTYEPPLDSDAAESAGHESLLDAGEKALGSIDRVRAIEGVLAYNMLKEKVKEFLQPFAEEKRIVGTEDVKKYFDQLQRASDTTPPGASRHDEN